MAIKQTLYRAGAGSSIIRSLQRAAECNKQVTVLVELTARFDEERNIQWARSLEEAGAHVIYGVRGYKTHAKICLIVRRGPQGLRRYVHLGTGNYNEQSARIYTDFGLLTSSPVLAEASASAPAEAVAPPLSLSADALASASALAVAPTSWISFARAGLPTRLRRSQSIAAGLAISATATALVAANRLKRHDLFMILSTTC